MFKNVYIKPVILAIIAVMIISIPAFSHATATTKRIAIPYSGFTDVGKTLYPAYVITGGMHGYIWTTVSNGKTISLTNVQLANTDMVFVDKELARNKNILRCGFICRNNSGEVVGINPAFKYLREK